MAKRSTRNKIRWQFEQSIRKLDSVIEHMRKADETAFGEHPRLTEYLPDVVIAIEALKLTLIDFRDRI